MCKHLLGSLCIFALMTPSISGQVYFSNPESAVFDTLNQRYLISNVGTGNIVEITLAWDTSFFDTSLNQTLGMVIVENTVYVTDWSGVVGFDLTTGWMLPPITIPGMTDLNDITADTSGYLWVTDSYARRVYRVNLADRSSEIVLSNIYWPNGVLFDPPNNRVLLCTFGNNVTIRAIDAADLSVSSVVTTGLRDLDGMTVDQDGNFYVSAFSNGRIYKYDNQFLNPPRLVSSGHDNPADIYYNLSDSTLVVPNWGGHYVEFLSMRDPDGDTVPEFRDNCPDVPNPEQVDSDGDGVGNDCDNCDYTDNADQLNNDTDSLGDACDNCPHTYNPDQEDYDGAGGGDVCCCGEYADGYTGNVNCSVDGLITLSDITRLIDRVFISKEPLCCEISGNVNGDPEELLTLSDITRLIDNVYISRSATELCP